MGRGEGGVCVVCVCVLGCGGALLPPAKQGSDWHHLPPHSSSCMAAP